MSEDNETAGALSSESNSIRQHLVNTMAQTMRREGEDHTKNIDGIAERVADQLMVQFAVLHKTEYSRMRYELTITEAQRDEIGFQAYKRAIADIRRRRVRLDMEL